MTSNAERVFSLRYRKTAFHNNCMCSKLHFFVENFCDLPVNNELDPTINNIELLSTLLQFLPIHLTRKKNANTFTTLKHKPWQF